jgi:hypothetical protein
VALIHSFRAFKVTHTEALTTSDKFQDTAVLYTAPAPVGLGDCLMGIGACRSAFAQAYLLADLENFFLRHHNTGQVVGTYLTAPIGREIVRPEFACLPPKLTM